MTTSSAARPERAGLPGRSASPAQRPSVVMRRLGDGEGDLFLAHLKRLDPAARRLRFGTVVNDAFLERYASLSLSTDAMVKGLFVDGILRGVSELRFLTGSREEAEAALSIETAHQGCGYGDLLFGRLVAAARNRGVRRLFLTCLRDNRRMQAIAARHGADLSIHHDEVMAELRRPHADAATIRRELGDEAEAYVFALLDWRRRRWARIAAPFKRFGSSLVGKATQE